MNKNKTSTVETFTGLNEQQMFQYEEIKLWYSTEPDPIYLDEDFEDRYKNRYSDYAPFFKH